MYNDFHDSPLKNPVHSTIARSILKLNTHTIKSLVRISCAMNRPGLHVSQIWATVPEFLKNHYVGALGHVFPLGFLLFWVTSAHVVEMMWGLGNWVVFSWNNLVFEELGHIQLNGIFQEHVFPKKHLTAREIFSFVPTKHT